MRVFKIKTKEEITKILAQAYRNRWNRLNNLKKTSCVICGKEGDYLTKETKEFLCGEHWDTNEQAKKYKRGIFIKR
jgi:hypothetical protein